MIRLRTILPSLLLVGLALPASAQNGTSNPKALVKLWYETNGQCRGGSRPDRQTLEACDARDAYEKRLRQVNWCYGTRGQYMYQMEWHACTAKSLR